MVPVLVAAGYRVVAPDFIGQTSKQRLAMGKLIFHLKRKKNGQGLANETKS